MGKLNLNQPILNINGMPLRTPPPEEGGQGEVVTLGAIIINSLLLDEKGLSPSEKMRRYDLSLAIMAAKEPLEFMRSDLELMKQKVDEIQPPLIMPQASRMIQKVLDEPEQAELKAVPSAPGSKK